MPFCYLNFIKKEVDFYCKAAGKMLVCKVLTTHQQRTEKADYQV